MTRPLTEKNLAELSAQLESTGKIDMSKLSPGPKRRKNEESQIQRAIIHWWRFKHREFGVPEQLLFSIPNGGNWDAKRGSIMKAEGQRKGAPDLVLMVPRHQRTNCWRHGLFLELKTPTGIVSPEQTAFRAALETQGYRVEVCRSFDQAVNVIAEYLGPNDRSQPHAEDKA